MPEPGELCDHCTALAADRYVTLVLEAERQCVEVSMGCNIYRTVGIVKESQMAKEFEEFRRRVNSFRRWVRTASMWPSAP